MTAPLVVCDHAARTFRSGAAVVVAVADLHLELSAGARCALQGPSGAGKSTVLHLLAGLDTPTSGTVVWPGLHTSPPFGVGDIGVVFQGSSLIRDLNAVENVAFPLQVAGWSDHDAHRRAHEALERLSLQSLATSSPDHMSGGQAQRVAIARVLACRPKLILADEPTGQLDSDTAAQVVDTLIAAADDTAAALVVSTHDDRVAARFATRWRMGAGRVVGDPLELRAAGTFR